MSKHWYLKKSYIIYLGKETAVSLITKFKTNNEEIILKFKFHYIIIKRRDNIMELKF